MIGVVLDHTHIITRFWVGVNENVHILWLCFQGRITPYAAGWMFGSLLVFLTKPWPDATMLALAGNAQGETSWLPTSWNTNLMWP